jgi:hypothetical protein
MKAKPPWTAFLLFTARYLNALFFLPAIYLIDIIALSAQT